MSVILDLDIELLRWIQDNRLSSLDNILYWISFVTTYVSITILLVLCYRAFVQKVLNATSIFYGMLAMFLTSFLLNSLIKTIIARSRPFATYPDIIKLSEGGSFSFPSGHTTEAFTMAIGLTLLLRKRSVAVPMIIWACVIGYSRMALGVHYPTDVLASIILATLIGFSIKSILSRKKVEVA